MRFHVSSRRLFVPERWVVFGFHNGSGSILTPQVFPGPSPDGFFSSRQETLQAVRDAFETPGQLGDVFIRATRGWTFLPVRIDDGYTNGVLDALRLGGVG